MKRRENAIWSGSRKRSARALFSALGVFRSRSLRAPRGSACFLPSGESIPEHSLPSLGILLDDTATALRGFDVERTAPKPRSGSEPSPGVGSHHPEHHHRRGSRPKPSLGGRSGANATNTASPLPLGHCMPTLQSPMAGLDLQDGSRLVRSCGGQALEDRKINSCKCRCFPQPNHSDDPTAATLLHLALSTSSQRTMAVAVIQQDAVPWTQRHSSPVCSW